MNVLMMPIRADAIYISEQTRVVGPTSDFEILPWFDGSRDHNGQTAHLGAAINARPFADHGAWLEPGIHLHWALPHGLTRGGSKRSITRYIQVDELWVPPAPNRWLIMRRATAGDATDRAWLVESDFLHPSGDIPDASSTVFPKFDAGPGERPWVRVGRQVELDVDTLTPKEPGFEAMTAERAVTAQGPALSALAHHDPYFAAHYPSCRGIFGLYDDTPRDDEAVYDVFGWYGGEVADPLARLVDSVRSDPDTAIGLIAEQRHKAKQVPTLTDPDQLTSEDWNLALNLAVRKAFGRGSFHAPSWEFPRTLLCHGRTFIDAAATTDITQPTKTGAIGVGSSPAEAVAAYLQGEAGEGAVDEDKLLQSLSATDLSAHPLDFGLKLREARHNEQFRGYAGHRIWAIRPRDDNKVRKHRALPELDEALAHELNRLNEIQEAYDASRDRISTMRQDTFAAWARYMQVAYPEGDQDPFAIDPGMLSDFVDREHLAPLEHLLDATGELFLSETEDGQLTVSDDIFRGATGPVPYGDMVGYRRGVEATSVTPMGRISGIDLMTGAIVDSVQMFGPEGPGGRCGGGRGNLTRLDLRDGEHVTALFGSYGPWGGNHLITRIGVETSFGRVIGPLGWDPGGAPTPWRLEAPHGAAITGLRGFGVPFLNAIGILVSPLNGAAARPEPPAASLAAAVVEQHRIVRALLRDEERNHELQLGLLPGPRFWRPHDPVIALYDDHARPSARHTPDAPGVPDSAKHFYTLELPDWETANDPDTGKAPAFLQLPGDGFIRPGHLGWATRSEGECWHPLFLEWQVEVEPLAERSNATTGLYDSAFVTRHHQLPDDSVDLIKTGAVNLVKTYEYLSGRAPLNPTIGALMAQRVADLPPSLAAAGAGAAGDVPSILPLGGFHDRLLMRRNELQLPIRDPIGVPAQKALANRVRAALGSHYPTTSVARQHFHPIRSGELIFQQLRLVDVFGRTKDWRPGHVHKTRRMQPSADKADRAWLPVRFSQAARLNFRWLSGAHENEVESNSHPATSPVCGWILPNELDGEIDLYDRDGRMLGVVDSQARWTPAPGSDTAPRSVLDIEDRALRRLAQWLVRESGDDLIGRFVDTLDLALHQIDPMDAARRPPRAALVGRPLAIVRARLDLQAFGGIAHDQSMAVIRAGVDRVPTSTTHGLEAVAIPVRLGEHGALNDALCGYWIEKGAGFRGQMFHTPHGLKVTGSHHHIRVLSNERLADYPLKLSLGGPAEVVTMLIDPRGVVHATTGLLPVKSIAVPPEHYQPAMDSLRSVFKTGPLLMPRGGIAVPLPVESGYSWSWIGKENDEWQAVPHHPVIEKPDLIAAIGVAGAQLWDRLVDLGRLMPEDHADRAVLMPGAEGAPGDRFTDLGLTPAEVETALHRLARWIEGADTHSGFEGRAMVRDGWLQLRPLPQLAGTAKLSADQEDDG